MKRVARAVLILALALMCASTTVADVLVLDDPLTGSTTGTRNGGVLQADGWHVAAQRDCIIWHLPYTIQRGRVEFDVRGINPKEAREPLNDKTDIFHMYDWTWGDADRDYMGYRNNPYKHFIRKIGSIGGSTDALELLFKPRADYMEPDSRRLTWDSKIAYHFTVTWEPISIGRCCMKISRDGVLLKTMTVAGSWNPEGHAVRIGDAHPGYGGPIDAVYSNLKVWDTSTAAPAAPEVASPKDGSTVDTQTPMIRLAGDDHAKYQIRVCKTDNPGSDIAWDSGEVTSVRHFTMSEELPDGQYYVFARLWNPTGWGAWSAAGHQFRVEATLDR